MGASSSMDDPSPSSPAIPWPWPCCGTASAARAWRDTVPRRRLRELPRRRSMGSRTCGPARLLRDPGSRSCSHPAGGLPPLPVVRTTAATATPLGREIEVERAEVDVAVVGGGSAGLEAAATAERAGKSVLVLDAGSGDEVVAIYAGPLIVVRTQAGMLHVHAEEIVVATGAAEIQPVCPGSGLRGLVHRGAAERLQAAGVTLDEAVAVGAVPAGVGASAADGRVAGSKATTGRVRAVVTVDEATGAETTTAGTHRRPRAGPAPRDVLARMAGEVPLIRGRCRRRGRRRSHRRPPTGVVCRCMGTTVDDLDEAWSKGFQDLELVKRSSQACLGHVPGRRVPAAPPLVDRRPDRRGAGSPFTARPASRQITLGEAAADTHIDAFRRTPLHDEHLALGARMDRFGGWWRPWNYGDPIDEYWAVREGVSLGDVSTLGQDDRVGPGRGRGARAALPVPRRGHQARPLALRAAAQRARPRHGRRHDPARVGDPVRADVHVRRRGQRRDVDPRLDRVRGASTSTSWIARCRSPRSTSPGRWRASCCSAPAWPIRRGSSARPRRRRRRAVPRDAPVVHRRGQLRAAPPGRPLGRAVAGADGRWARTSGSARTACRRCSGCGSRRATSSSAWTPSWTRRRAASAWTGRCGWRSRTSSAAPRWRAPPKLDDHRRLFGLHDGRPGADRGRADPRPTARSSAT